MGFDSNMTDAIDREVGRKIDHLEENRQQQWTERREDRESVRENITKLTEEWDDPQPKQKIEDDSDDYSPMGRFKGLREGIVQDFKTTWLDAEQEERRQEKYRKLDLLEKQLQRSHGVTDLHQGIAQMLEIERGLRGTDEEFNAALQHQINLRNNGYAQHIDIREHENTKKGVVDVFDQYEIDKAVEPYMIEYMRTPEFQNSKTGDIEADIKRAYRMVTEGLKRARMPGNYR